MCVWWSVRVLFYRYYLRAQMLPLTGPERHARAAIATQTDPRLATAAATATGPINGVRVGPAPSTLPPHRTTTVSMNTGSAATHHAHTSTSLLAGPAATVAVVSAAAEAGHPGLSQHPSTAPIPAPLPAAVAAYHAIPSPQPGMPLIPGPTHPEHGQQGPQQEQTLFNPTAAEGEQVGGSGQGIHVHSHAHNVHVQAVAMAEPVILQRAAAVPEV
jgi:hypothetical protein